MLSVVAFAGGCIPVETKCKVYEEFRKDCAKVSASDVAFLLHGPTPGKRLIGMIYGYFDGSSEGKVISKVSSFCGVIGTEVQWKTLDLKWNKVLDDPKWRNRPRRFHATDVVNGTKDFLGWGYSARLAFWAELMQILIDGDFLAAGVACLEEAYAMLPSYVREGFGPSHYLMMEHAIQTSIEETRERWPGENLGLIFDRMDKATAEHVSIRFLDYSLEWNTLASYGFGDSYKMTMLQAADMCAYSAYRFHMENGYPGDTDPDFKVTPLILRLVESIKTTGVVWNYETLMDIYKRGPKTFSWGIPE